MADNYNATAGSGLVFAADDVGGSVLVPRVKLTQGADGTATDVNSTTPLESKLTNLEKAEDAVHSSGDKGLMALAVRTDTMANSAGTTGDYSAIANDASGRLYVTDQAVAGDGISTARNLGATSTGQVLINAAASLWSVAATNGDSGKLFFKLYDKATAATSGDTPIAVIAVAAGTTISKTFPKGVKLANGLSVRAVTGIADNDATGATAAKAHMSCTYK